MAKQPKPLPVNPYLTVKGAADAIAFYQKAFGAEENARMPAQDGKRIMHACLTINGGAVMLSDEFPEYAEHGATNAPSKDKPAPVATCLQLTKPAEVDAMYQRAVEAGCMTTMAPENTFWDARFAMLVDPFGHRWMLNAPLPKKPAAKKKQQPAG
ncbi:MAG: glyoxalase/bleomycin resistance/extradiol dioxygenase family protein [Hyphomicrobiaceae bacterium]|jgi:PhnB protein